MSAIFRAAWRTGFALLVLACFGCVKIAWRPSIRSLWWAPPSARWTSPSSEAGTNDVYHRRLSPDDRPVTPARAALNLWRLAGWDANDIVLAPGPGAARLIVQSRYDQRIFSRLIGSTGSWATMVDPFARSLLLGGAISLGDGRIAVLAADPRDGRLYLARQAGGDGSVFLPLIGQSADARFFLPTKPAVAGE